MLKKILSISLLVSIMQVVGGILLIMNIWSFRKVDTFFGYYWIISAGLLIISFFFLMKKTRAMSLDIYFALILTSSVILSISIANIFSVFVVIFWVVLSLAYFIRRAILNKRI